MYVILKLIQVLERFLLLMNYYLTYKNIMMKFPNLKTLIRTSLYLVTTMALDLLHINKLNEEKEKLQKKQMLNKFDYMISDTHVLLYLLIIKHR
jgi:hypothetical protein